MQCSELHATKDHSHPQHSHPPLCLCWAAAMTLPASQLLGREEERREGGGDGNVLKQSWLTATALSCSSLSSLKSFRVWYIISTLVLGQKKKSYIKIQIFDWKTDFHKQHLKLEFPNSHRLALPRRFALFHINCFSASFSSLNRPEPEEAAWTQPLCCWTAETRAATWSPHWMTSLQRIWDKEGEEARSCHAGLTPSQQVSATWTPCRRQLGTEAS